MKGKLDFSIRENWFISVELNNEVERFKSFPIWSELKANYHESMIGTEVDCELVLINPMGWEMDPNDLTKNLSSCNWFAKINNEEKLLEKKNSSHQSEKNLDKLIEELADKLWSDYKDTLQESQYMVRLTFIQREKDFKSGVNYLINSLLLKK